MAGYALLLFALVVARAISPLPPSGVYMNTPGNILIVATGDDSVFEAFYTVLDEVAHALTCENSTFFIGPGLGCDTGHVYGPVWAQRFGCADTLVVSAGNLNCPDNRVILFDPCSDAYFWFGDFAPGSDDQHLNNPKHAAVIRTDIDRGHRVKDVCNETFEVEPILFIFRDVDIIITDSGNNRILIIEVYNCAHDEGQFHSRLVWKFGPTSGHLKLNNPSMSQVLGNGNILIADTGNHRILEIDRRGRLVSEFNTSIPSPTSVSRIDWEWVTNITDQSELLGEELIVDSTRNEFIQLNTFTGKVKNTFPNRVEGEYSPTGLEYHIDDLTYALRVFDKNHYLIVDAKQGAVYLYNRHKDSIDVTVPELDNPLSASMIGDYMGLTVPPYYPDYPLQQCPFGGGTPDLRFCELCYFD